MEFTTLKFIIFMVVVFTLYYIIPKGRQWQLLLLASYVFYGVASPVFLLFLVFTTTVTYLGGVKLGNNISKRQEYLQGEGIALSREEKKTYRISFQKNQKRVLIIVITVLILMLAYFKYATFILDNFSLLIGIFGIKAKNTTLNIILPVGLSFYIFQSIGYCIDVYREMAEPEYNFLKYALYISFFPQILSGPIADYNRLAPQLFSHHSFSYNNAKYGLQRISWGFFKKLVVSNHIVLVIDGIWSSYESYSGFLFWEFIAILYAFQLYADFSGYTDIAIGSAQMLGITLDENFTTPYISKNIPEYWRRWHITLGAWFRNYVFYPILRTSWCEKIRKKNKKTHPYISNVVPTSIALLIVWSLIGLWHGADWSYVAHGLFHGTIIILSTILGPIYSKIDTLFPRKSNSRLYLLFQIARTFIIVTWGYLIFGPANLLITKGIIRRMFDGLGIGEIINIGHLNAKSFVQIIIGLCILVIVDIWHYTRKSSLRDNISTMSRWKRCTIYVSFLLVIIFLGVYGQPELNQFAYFRF